MTRGHSSKQHDAGLDPCPRSSGGEPGHPWVCLPGAHHTHVESTLGLNSSISAHEPPTSISSRRGDAQATYLGWGGAEIQNHLPEPSQVTSPGDV